MNRDPGDSYKEQSKWSLIDSILDAYQKNKATFLVGFFMTAFICFVMIVNDPLDRAGYYQYLRKKEIEEGDDYRIIDKQYGYERKLQREREKENFPKTYDA